VTADAWVGGLAGAGFLWAHPVGNQTRGVIHRNAAVMSDCTRLVPMQEQMQSTTLATSLVVRSLWAAARRLEPMERLEMPQTTDGVPAALLGVIKWTKSSHSNPDGNCVQGAELTGGKVGVRNSRHPGGPALVYPRAEVAVFVQAVKEGEFNQVIPTV
jgi:hypothetical protein